MRWLPVEVAAATAARGTGEQRSAQKSKSNEPRERERCAGHCEHRIRTPDLNTLAQTFESDFESSSSDVLTKVVEPMPMSEHRYALGARRNFVSTVVTHTDP
jgi:hypothetical protein